LKIYSKGFSLTELIIVVMGIGILASISIPLLYGFIEKAEVSVAKRYLRLAVRECQRQLIDGVVNPSFTKPPQSLGIIPTRRFQFPDSGNDGECLSPSSGNILTAARTLNTQTESTYNININVVSGEKSTQKNIPKWLNWQGFYSPLIPNDEN
tara:strand:- start:70 stop:528 length:459 start_codon:yes stop_codon:yes gene_type:complete